MFAGSEVTYQRKSQSPEKKNSIDPMNFCANEDGQTVLCKTRKIIPNNINHQNSTALWGFEEITQTLPFESESPTYGTTSLWGTSECSVVPRGTKRTTIWGTFDSNKAEGINSKFSVSRFSIRRLASTMLASPTLVLPVAWLLLREIVGNMIRATMMRR